MERGFGFWPTVLYQQKSNSTEVLTSRLEETGGIAASPYKLYVEVRFPISRMRLRHLELSSASAGFFNVSDSLCLPISNFHRATFSHK